MNRDITVSFYTGWLWWKREHTRTYRGSGTVWHDVETGRRPEGEYGLLGYDILDEIMRKDWLLSQAEAK